jgi:hypothetical protein
VEGVVHTQIVLYGYLLFGNIVVIIFIGLMIFAVSRQENKSVRYLIRGQGKNQKKTRSTAWQGVRFSAAYLVPYLMYYVFFFWNLAGRIDRDEPDAGEFVLYYWLVIVTPLLGAFNSAVYFYPRYATHRKQNPEKSRLACLREVLGVENDWCHSRKRTESETSAASTPLINEEEVIQSVL